MSRKTTNCTQNRKRYDSKAVYFQIFETRALEKTVLEAKQWEKEYSNAQQELPLVLRFSFFQKKSQQAGQHVQRSSRCPDYTSPFSTSNYRTNQCITVNQITLNSKPFFTLFLSDFRFSVAVIQICIPFFSLV